MFEKKQLNNMLVHVENKSAQELAREKWLVPFKGPCKFVNLSKTRAQTV